MHVGEGQSEDRLSLFYFLGLIAAAALSPGQDLAIGDGRAPVVSFGQKFFHSENRRAG
jgi:hypothetical protein